MFLHLGNDISIRLREVISIHDYGIFRQGPNRDFWEKMEKGAIHALGEGQEKKSVILTKDRVYVSAISPLTLKRRAGQLE